MSGADDETDTSELREDEEIWQHRPDALFGSYSVLSPGVQIVLDGRSVSAPQAD